MATPNRTILLTAASGNIGTALLPLLALSPNTNLILPTRNAASLHSNLPPSPTAKIHIEEGTLSDPLWFQTLLTRHNVDTVFLCLQGSHGSELDTTLNLLSAMHLAGTVAQLVYLSICGDFTSPQGIAHLTAACPAAHVLVKIPIELHLQNAGYDWATTVLGPTLFWSNDQFCRQGLLEQGVFDFPIAKASRVSTRDIALAARNVIFSPRGKYAGQKIQLGSLDQISGEETAALWARALGKDVRPWGKGEGEGWKAFEDRIAGFAGRGFARETRLMYECFEKWGFGMSEGEYEVQKEVLGKEADDYTAWVVDDGKRWIEALGA